MSGDGDLVLLVPSRGRPDNVRRLLHACAETAPDMTVFIGVDTTDSKFLQYLEIASERLTRGAVVTIPPEQSNGQGMVGALNILASLHTRDFEMVGFMGDDHLPRTANWSVELCRAIKQQGGGIAYGNDLLQGSALPTAVVMESAIPRTLGYMAPPQLEHLWVDAVWRDWGMGLGQFTYRQDIILEHLHPGANKADWDIEYARTGSSDKNDRDIKAYQLYCEQRLQDDIMKLKKRHGAR